MAVDKFSGVEFGMVIASRVALEQALETLEKTCNEQGRECVRQRIKKKLGEIRVDLNGTKTDE